MNSIFYFIKKFQLKSKDQHLINTILIFILSFSFLMLTKFKNIPDSTHYLAAYTILDPTLAEYEINKIIRFILTPSYYLIYLTFLNPLLFNFITFISSIAKLSLLYFLINYLIKNQNISLFCVGFIVFLKLLIYGLNFIGLEDINYFESSFFLKDDFFNYFTIRHLFGFIYILSIYFFLIKKHWTSVALIFLNNFTHPNSNIFVIGFFFIILSYLFLKKEIDIKLFIFFLITNFLFILSAFLKINDFYINTVPTSSNDYYVALIKDEADDFSLLANLIFRFKWILLIFLVHLINLRFYFKKNKNDFLFLITILPLVSFVILSLIEFICVKLNINFILNIIINTQPGWKILGYSFYSSLFILAINIKNYEKNFLPLIKLSKYLILISSFIFMTLFYSFKLDEFKSHSKFLIKNKFNIVEYDSWLFNFNKDNNFFPTLYNSNLETDEDYKRSKNIFIIKKLIPKNIIKKNKQTKIEFESDEGFELIKIINQRIKSGSGIIIMPYILNGRGLLKNYRIYLTEHPDGNFAMGNKKFFSVINDRMLNLLDVNYSSFPIKNTNLNYSYLRNKFLKLDEAKFLNIKLNNPKFKYLVTENKNLNFKIIQKTKNFYIYEIDHK